MHTTGKKHQGKQEIDLKTNIAGIPIRIKAIILLASFVVVSISVVGFIATMAGERLVSKQAEAHLKRTSCQKSTGYNAVFLRLQNEVEGVAEYAAAMFDRKASLSRKLGENVLMPWTGEKYGSPKLEAKFAKDILALERINEMLTGIVHNNPYVRYGYMATKDGIMVQHDNKIDDLKALEAYIPQERPWYVDAEKAKKAIWTKPYADPNGDKLTITVAAPVFGAYNSLIGVVAFDVLLDTILENILALDIGCENQSFVIDQNADFIIKPDMQNNPIKWNEEFKAENALKSTNTDYKQVIRKMVAGEKGIASYTEKGAHIFLSYAPLPAIEASLGIAVSREDILRQARLIRWLIPGVCLVMIVLSIITGIIVGNRITRVIDEIVERADLISQGKTDLEPIRTSRKDELGVLVASFNRLIVSLKMAMSLIQKK